MEKVQFLVWAASSNYVIDCLHSCSRCSKSGKMLKPCCDNRLIAMDNLAGIYGESGQYEKAETLILKCLNKRKELFGINYPETVSVMVSLAMLYLIPGKHLQAERLLYCLEKRRLSLGPDHPKTLELTKHLS
jgi:hypothetical protein